MPVKNASPYLHDCIQSILNQEDPYWELIAIDDHSSDESYQILLEFKNADDRIQCYTNRGSGIISALHQALSLSQGRYITRMDADDIMPPDKLSQLKAALQKVGKGHVITGLVSYFSEGTLGDGYRRYAEWLNGLTLTHQNYSEIYKECVIPSPCWMVERRDLLRCGGFHSDLYPEDYDLCFRFYKNNLKVHGVDKVLHYWRDHADRASRNDDHYAEQHFFPLKTKYFLSLEVGPKDSIILWGAGKKGKILAKVLIGHGVGFRWVCDNPNKIGREIYHIPLEDCLNIEKEEKQKIIIAIASPKANQGIKDLLESKGLCAGDDYHFFC